MSSMTTYNMADGRPWDIVSRPFIMPETGSGTREIIDDFLRKMKIDLQELKIIMTLGDPELLVRMVQLGLGIAFVSKWSIFKTLQEGSIRIVSVTGEKLCRKIYLISLEKEPATMVAGTFKNLFKDIGSLSPFRGEAAREGVLIKRRKMNEKIRLYGVRVCL